MNKHGKNNEVQTQVTHEREANIMRKRRRKKTNIRSKAYKALRISNDINAIVKGRYFQRLLRKWTLRKSGNKINRFFK